MTAMVPHNVNPYMVLRQEFAQAFLFTAPKSSNPLLILGSVLLAICSTVFLAGFFVRARRGTLWAFRIVRFGREKYLLGSLVFYKGGFDAITSMSKPQFQDFLY